MRRLVYVADASVGVKWFRNERGSDEALELLAGHIERQHFIAVDSLFYYEVLRAASRDGRPIDAERIWRDLKAQDFITVPLGDELVAAAVEVANKCGCTLYDAFSAGLARLLEAQLVSADARAHGSLSNTRIIG